MTINVCFYKLVCIRTPFLLLVYEVKDIVRNRMIFHTALHLYIETLIKHFCDFAKLGTFFQAAFVMKKNMSMQRLHFSLD